METMTPESKLWHLNNFNLLDALSDEEKEVMSKLVSDRNSNKGETLYFPEDAANKIFFLKTGKVKISQFSESGKELIYSIVGPGEVFGELAVAGSKSRNEIAEVMEDAIICGITSNQMEAMVQKNPNFGLSVTKLIGLKFKKISTRLESLVFKSSEERIIGFIKEMADEHGVLLGGGPEISIRLKLTHEDISKLTASTRQTVTSVFSQLQREGKILYDRSSILVKKYNEL